MKKKARATAELPNVPPLRPLAWRGENNWSAKYKWKSRNRYQYSRHHDGVAFPNPSFRRKPESSRNALFTGFPPVRE